jgi:hypothetical protein
MKRWLQPALIGLMAIGPLSIWSEVQRESFDVMVPQAPIPVITEGHVTLIYELHLTNFASEPLLVRKLRVINPDKWKSNCRLRRFGSSESIYSGGGLGPA